jgi:hypothetical protein
MQETNITAKDRQNNNLIKLLGFITTSLTRYYHSTIRHSTGKTIVKVLMIYRDTNRYSEENPRRETPEESIFDYNEDTRLPPDEATPGMTNSFNPQ